MFFVRKPTKILAVVNHFYGANQRFYGGSSCRDPDHRRSIVARVVESLRQLPDTEICIFGMQQQSLIPLDRDCSGVDPSFLVYESIQWMCSQARRYRYFINMEDDILLDRDTFARITEFDDENPVNECFHPNRVEHKDSGEYFIDLDARPGWTTHTKQWRGYNLRVANNPHSGVAVLSQAKLLYARRRVNLRRRDKIIGHYMASAYANLHSPFLLYRSSPELAAHTVTHLDHWDPLWYQKLASRGTAC